VIPCKTSKETPQRTAVSRILTAVPIWEGCASKKALRGVIIRLLCILPHPLYVFRGIEKNETRYEIASAKGDPSRLFQGYPHPLPAYSRPEDTRSIKRKRGESRTTHLFVSITFLSLFFTQICCRYQYRRDYLPMSLPISSYLVLVLLSVFSLTFFPVRRGFAVYLI